MTISVMHLDIYKCRFQMMPGIYEYHRWKAGNMVQQTNSCSDILYLYKKYSLISSILVQETVHHIFLTHSVPADQFIVSIHSGEECLYQSVLGGRGEREKVGTEEKNS